MGKVLPKWLGNGMGKIVLDLMGKIIPSLAMTTKTLQEIIERHAEEQDRAPATLCKAAADNQRLYGTLSKGGTCTIEVANRLLLRLGYPPLQVLTKKEMATLGRQVDI